MIDEPHKVVLLGESNVGKIDIIVQYSLGYWDPDKVNSMSAQFVRKTLDLEDGKSITLDIWDTPGQEQYRSLSKIICMRAEAIIFVYDITNKKTFTELKEYWYPQIINGEKKEVVLVVAGNKNELYQQQEISNGEAEEWAKSIGAVFFSISVKGDNGIKEMFKYIGKKLLNPEFDYYANLPNKKIKNKTNDEKKIKNKTNEKKDDKKCLIY